MSDSLVVEPLQRRTYEAAELMRRHPPVLRNDNKQVLFAIASPPGTVHAGRLEYSRWPELPLSTARAVDPDRLGRQVVVRDGYYDYRPVLGAGVGVEWHVNFADPNLFYAYGTSLFAQDEIQVAEHPVLGSLREALVAGGEPATTIANSRPTPVLVIGAERRVSMRTAPGAESGGPSWLYGMAFARASADAVREAATRIDPPSISNILAWPRTAAAADTGGRRSASRSRPPTPASGPRSSSPGGSPDPAPGSASTPFWGCGAFGGNRVMMTLLQVLAADMAGVDRLALHVGDSMGRTSVERAIALASELATAAGAPDLIARAEQLGLAWGVSDGN